MSCRIGPNVEFKQRAVVRQRLRSFEEANISFEQGNH
jgi:hypothetical protein